MSNKRVQNKRIREQMSDWYISGFTLGDFWRSYEGPQRSYQSIRDMWNSMEQEFDETVGLEETAQLLHELACRLSAARDRGVEDWALASFCSMSEEDFCTMMAALGV